MGRPVGRSTFAGARKILRRLSWRSGKDLGEFSRPRGYEAVTAAVAGVMYEGRSKFVSQLRLRERVWLRRESSNRFDRNAVAVTDTRRHQVGYLPRYIAARMGPHLNKVGTVPAVVTELLSDMSGAVMGAKIGFYVPAGLVGPRTETAEWYCEQLESGIVYILLDCDAAELNRIIDQLKASGLAIARQGVNYRQASNGQGYKWYVRLVDARAKAQAQSILRAIVGKTMREQIQELYELLDESTRPGARLDTEGVAEERHVEKGRLEARNRQLIGDLERLQRLLGEEKERRSGRRDASRDVETAIRVLLPEVTFLQDSIDVTTREIRSPAQVLEIIRSIVKGENVEGKKKVRATPDGWWEKYFNTGQGNNGRLYWKEESKGFWKILVSVKDRQELDLKNVLR